MRRFVLIDHSLKGVGGHHYEYALHVARAAEAAGMRPVIAAHRRFTNRGLMPQRWEYHTPYYRSTYSNHALLGNLAQWQADYHRAVVRHDSMPAAFQPLHWAWTQAQDRFRHWRRRRGGDAQNLAFEQGTLALFSRLSLAPGDQVFVPTLNELDLIGLIRYLRSDSRSRNADWHLQFHYDIDLESSSTNETYHNRLQEIFGECQDLLATHRLHFYTTTAQLADQYNALDTVHFRDLPYPVNPAFQRSERAASFKAPLLATCLGGVRHEKGLELLPDVLDELWKDYFATGRVQVLLQAKRPKKLPLAVRSRIKSSPNEPVVHRPIRIAPHPLGSDAYMRLVHESDIGLFLYDRQRYLNRCSGVLVEMLTAGVPVIVPAGCWLADQLAEEIHRHHEGLRQRLPIVQTIHDPPADVTVPQGATHVLAAFEWSGAETDGSALVQFSQFDSRGNRLSSPCGMAGQPPGGHCATALTTLAKDTCRIDFEWRCSLEDTALQVHNLRLDFLSADAAAGQPCPLAAVGLIAADPSQQPALLRELVDNYPHYRKTAADFARRWIQWHNPSRVVGELLAEAHPISNAA